MNVKVVNSDLALLLSKPSIVVLSIIDAFYKTKRNRVHLLIALHVLILVIAVCVFSGR